MGYYCHDILLVMVSDAKNIDLLAVQNKFKLDLSLNLLCIKIVIASPPMLQMHGYRVPMARELVHFAVLRKMTVWDAVVWDSAGRATWASITNI